MLKISVMSTVKIEALKGADNYFSWQIQIQDVLTELKLIGYPLGEITQLTEPALITSWKEKD